MNPSPKVVKLFSYSTQLSTKFILLINVKMPTIVGILTFISMINTTSERHYHVQIQEFSSGGVQVNLTKTGPLAGSMY